MNISIKNYKNLSHLSFNIIEKKVNSLFGISGSGKTSIAEGLMKKDLEFNKRIDSISSEVEVLVDGVEVDPSQYRYFNIETSNNLIIEQTFSTDVYTVFFGDIKKINNIKSEISKLIVDLDNQGIKIQNFLDQIEIVKREFTGKLTKEGSLPRTAKLYQLENDVNKLISLPESTNFIKAQGVDVINWKLQGLTINTNYQNKICPFCDTNLSDETINLIESIKMITPKNFTIIKDSKVDFNVLKVNRPTDFTDIEEIKLFKTQLLNAIKISEDLHVVLDFIRSTRNPEMNPSNINPLNLSENTYSVFPELKQIIIQINAMIEQVKILMGNMKSTFKEMVGSNLKVINEYVKKLSIPYEFALDKFNDDEKKAEFRLYHIKDDKQQHRVNGLSFGEKNMLSLVLFLLIKDDKMLIIDDPASSFDDYRRKIILDIIYQLQNNRTLLILSHDHVFLKYALFLHESTMKKNEAQRSQIEKKYFENTGNIMYFENLKKPEIKLIEFNDFKPIEVHVREHLLAINDTASFYRKALNLRMIAELKKYSDCTDYQIIYNFLSAILHKRPKNEIEQLLIEKNLSIDDVLIKIKELMNYDLGSIPDNYMDVLDIGEFTLFERAIYLREKMNKDTIEKDELNNLVHYNSTLAIQLNPYKFNLFSPYTYSLIKI